MADKKIVALDIGSQTINGAVFARSSDGAVTMTACARSNMLGDPTTGGIKNDQVRLAVAEVLSELGESNSVVRYSLSGQSVFTRFLDLPAVEADKFDQIVEFEAQQNVPFPINEVVWDYQLIGDDSAEEKEAAIVAIKSDALNEINELVENNGVVTDIVDVAPMALINAFRHSYPEQTEPVLIIDVGSTATNLIFLQGNKVFTRTASVGGAQISASIAKEFGLPFMKAEQSKINEGYVSMGPAYEDDEDEARVAMSRVIRTSLSRLNSEITRTISYYRTQRQGEQPTEVYLSGGTVATPYFREFIEEKIGIPVSYLNPFNYIGVDDTVDTDDISTRAHELGEVIGLAVRDAADPRFLNFDLPPESVSRRRDVDKRKGSLLAAAALLIAALLIPILYFFYADGFAKKKNAELLSQRENFQPIYSKIKVAENRISTRNGEAEQLVERLKHNYEWLKLLSHLNQQFDTDHLWFTTFTPLVDGRPIFDYQGVRSKNKTTNNKRGNEKDVPQITEIRLTGLYREKNVADVDRLYEKLEKSEWFDFEGKQRKEIQRLTQQPDGSKWAYKFELKLPLAHPLPAN